MKKLALAVVAVFALALAGETALAQGRGGGGGGGGGGARWRRRRPGGGGGRAAAGVAAAAPAGAGRAGIAVAGRVPACPVAAADTAAVAAGYRVVAAAMGRLSRWRLLRRRVRRIPGPLVWRWMVRRRILGGYRGWYGPGVGIYWVAPATGGGAGRTTRITAPYPATTTPTRPTSPDEPTVYVEPPRRSAPRGHQLLVLLHGPGGLLPVRPELLQGLDDGRAAARSQSAEPLGSRAMTNSMGISP